MENKSQSPLAKPTIAERSCLVLLTIPFLVVLTIGLMIVNPFDDLFGARGSHRTQTTNAISLTAEALEYMHSVGQAVNLEDIDDFTGIELLQPYLDEYVVFVTGEVHGIAVNHELELKILKYLHQHAGVRYYLQEIPYSMGQMLNKYLETGDERILTHIFTAMTRTYNWNNEVYALYEQLYQYNKDLPEEERITVIGWDIEHRPQLALVYLREFFLKGGVPRRLAPVIDVLTSTSDTAPGSEIVEVATQLDASIRTHEMVYKEYMGEDNFFHFKTVVNGILNRGVVDNSGDHSYRDKSGYELFERLYPRLEGTGKFYGQWGRAHTAHKHIGDIAGFGTSLANHLNTEGSPVAGQVLSIHYYYTGVNRMDMSQGMYGTQAYSDVSAPKRAFNFGTRAPIVIDLMRPGSPFGQKSFLRSDLFGKQGPTTGYFQFMVLIQESPPNTPFSR